ncbi:MAG: gliding motility lipoprotein GldH [Muribaculaceae bacterium]|nr:gliding motility lipoprotein GldH [Muribaculaceae bacterium]
MRGHNRAGNICVFFTTCLILLCGSCRRVDDVVYSDFATFDREGWDPVCVIPFFPWPVDSVLSPSDRFDLILTLRYSPADASSVIPLEITEEDENGEIGTHRVSVRLRDKEGKPLGRKSVYLYEVSDTLRRDFALADGYLVGITSLSPLENTRGLRNIGLTLSLHRNRRPSLFPLPFSKQ